MTEILLYGDVGRHFDARWVAAALDAADGPALLRIHSYGGDAYEGVAISNVVRHAVEAGQDVTAVVDGMAASAASYMCLPASRLLVGPGAAMFAHNPLVAAVGDAGELRRTADELDRCRLSIVDLYVRKTGRSVAEVVSAMDADTTFTADEAVAWGLADGHDGGEAPDLSLVDSRWAGIDGSQQFAAFALAHEAMAQDLPSYIDGARRLKRAIARVEGSGIQAARDASATFEDTAQADEGDGAAPDPGSGEAPRLFTTGWDVLAIDPGKGDA